MMRAQDIHDVSTMYDSQELLFTIGPCIHQSQCQFARETTTLAALPPPNTTMMECRLLAIELKRAHAKKEGEKGHWPRWTACHLKRRGQREGEGKERNSPARGKPEQQPQKRRTMQPIQWMSAWKCGRLRRERARW